MDGGVGGGGGGQFKTSAFQPMRLQNTEVEPATISTARNNKVGWYENHERQVNLINKL